jgi:hypothetical protein
MATHVSILPTKPIETEEQATLVLSPFDVSPTSFTSALERRKTNRQAILNWIKDNLVEGIDFGIIPTKKGIPKKSLFKSGAERVCVLLGVIPTYPAFADYEQAAIQNQTFEQIIIRCELLLNGIVVASGVGARAIKDDFGNLNKSLKMATKSAMILATLSLVGLSEIFTTDLMDDDKASPSVPEFITPAQCEQVEQLIASHKVDKTRFMGWLSKLSQSKNLPAIAELNQLPVALFDNVIEKLPSFANSAK